MNDLTNALAKVKAQMTNPEENVMATATKKKVPTKRVKPETNGADHDEATEAAPAKKSTAKKKVSAAATDKAPVKKKEAADENVVTLRELCKDLKLEPHVARRYLRADKIPNPGRWAWPKGSKELNAARAALSE